MIITSRPRFFGKFIVPYAFPATTAIELRGHSDRLAIPRHQKHASARPASLSCRGSTFRVRVARCIFKEPQLLQKERFELRISAPEMRSAAIRFARQKHLVLDGTFGLSSAHLLMWIAMGMDDDNQDVPVAFLSSAPSGARATHARYNTPILTKLLRTWKASVR